LYLIFNLNAYILNRGIVVSVEELLNS